MAAFDPETEGVALAARDAYDRAHRDAAAPVAAQERIVAEHVIELNGLTGVESDPAKTVNRLRAVIAARKPHLSTTGLGLLDALVGYWGSVSDL